MDSRSAVAEEGTERENHMIQSMTGFGRGSAEVSGKRLVVEIRTINSRYLEANARLPREYLELEITAKAKIKAAFLRGRVDLTMNMESSAEETVSINEAILERYLILCRQIKEKYQLVQEPEIAQLLRLPMVIENAAAEMPAMEELRNAFEKALGQAITAVKEFRVCEGRSLAADMIHRLESLARQAGRIRELAADLPAICRDRLAERLRQLLPERLQVEERILLEAAVFADKSDISEELERLESHVAQFRSMIDAGGDAGRRLDFLLQEMNREANTILSKADLLEISQIGVEMKAEIERLREQVQNIE